MKNDKFIYTNNTETKSVLYNAGYPLLKQVNGGWVFINIKKLKFSTLSDVVYSDKLTFS